MAEGLQMEYNNKMKKLLFSLIATVMFVFSGIANNINDEVYAQVKIISVEKNSNLKPKSEISIRFNSTRKCYFIFTIQIVLCYKNSKKE